MQNGAQLGWIAGMLLCGLAVTSRGGLEGYWPLDEATGATAVDDVMSTQNGSMSGGSFLRYNNGKIGTALDCGERVRYVDTQRKSSSLGVSGGNARTISFWGWWLGDNNTHNCWFNFNYAAGGEFALYWRHDQHAWRVQSMGHNFTTGPAANQWQHWAVTYLSGTTRVYVNGTEQTASAVAISTHADANLLIGGQYGDNMRGRIDDFGVFNEALSAAKIKLIYNTCNTPALNYGLDKMQQLFDGYAGNTKVPIGEDRFWMKFTGGPTSTAGNVDVYDTTQYRMYFTTTAGMQSYPVVKGTLLLFR